MRSGVDPGRHPADDGRARGGEIGGKLLGHPQPI
jgi:hypothetical protein